MNKVVRLNTTLPELARQGLLAALMMAAHSVQKGAMDQLTAGGVYKALSVGYVDYIIRLAARDYAPGELADELGISKQLCSKVIRELEGRQLIRRRPNPGDSRSSLLSLSEEGEKLLNDGGHAADVVLRQMEESIGAEPLQQLTEVLEKLCHGLHLPVPGTGTLGASRQINLLLPVLADHIRGRLNAAVREQGFDRIGVSAGDVLGLISHEASQIRYIAAILGVSKQAVALAAAELDRLGYVTRVPHPDDGRQLILSLSPRGEQLIAAGVQGATAIEDSFKAILTAAEYRLLDQSMATWYDRVVGHYDPARVLRHKIQQLSGQLLADLGPAGARALAQQLMTLTRGRP